MRPNENTPRVLIVDDEPEMCALLAAFLRSQGYRVELRHSAEEAIAAVRSSKTPISAVVSDIGMKPMDGLMLLDALKSSNPGLPVILMTGNADVSQRRAALTRGASEYLAKPFTLEKLQEALLAATRKRG